MKYIMFTKHLEGLDIDQVIQTLLSVGVEGADLCVRSGYPVDPDNVPAGVPAFINVGELGTNSRLCIIE